MKILFIENKPTTDSTHLLKSLGIESKPDVIDDLLVKPIEKIAKEIRQKHASVDLFIINANVLASSRKRTDFAGIELLKFIRLYGINKHVILYSFMNREQIMLHGIKHQIIFTKGVSFFRLPDFFNCTAKADIDELIKIEADREELKNCFKSEYDPTNRHHEANWFGAWRLWQIHKALNNITNDQAKEILPDYHTLFKEKDSYVGLLTRYLNDVKEINVIAAKEKIRLRQGHEIKEIEQKMAEKSKNIIVDIETKKLYDNETAPEFRDITKLNKLLNEIKNDIDKIDQKIQELEKQRSKSSNHLNQLKNEYRKLEQQFQIDPLSKEDDIELIDLDISDQKEKNREELGRLSADIKLTNEETGKLKAKLIETKSEIDTYIQEYQTVEKSSSKNIFIKLWYKWNRSARNKLNERLKDIEQKKLKANHAFLLIESDIGVLDGILSDTLQKVNELEKNHDVYNEVIRRLKRASSCLLEIKEVDGKIVQIDNAIYSEKSERSKLVERETNISTRMQQVKDSIISEEKRLQDQIQDTQMELDNLKNDIHRITHELTAKFGHQTEILPVIQQIQKKSPKILYIDDQADWGWSTILKGICYAKDDANAAKKFTVYQPNTYDSIDAVIQQTKNLLKREQPDLLMIDLRLKEEKGSDIDPFEISGVKVIRAIREEIGCPILVFTASQKTTMFKIAIQQGANAIWMKEGTDTFHSEDTSIQNYDDLVQQIHFFCCNETFRSLIKMKNEFIKFKIDLEDNKQKNDVFWWQRKFWKSPLVTKEKVTAQDILPILNEGFAMIDHYIMSLFTTNNSYMLSHSNSSIQMAIPQLYRVFEVIFSCKGEYASLHLNQKIDLLGGYKYLSDSKSLSTYRNDIIHKNRVLKPSDLTKFVTDLFHVLCKE